MAELRLSDQVYLTKNLTHDAAYQQLKEPAAKRRHRQAAGKRRNKATKPKGTTKVRVAKKDLADAAPATGDARPTPAKGKHKRN